MSMQYATARGCVRLVEPTVYISGVRVVIDIGFNVSKMTEDIVICIDVCINVMRICAV